MSHISLALGGQVGVQNAISGSNMLTLNLLCSKSQRYGQVYHIVVPRKEYYCSSKASIVCVAYAELAKCALQMESKVQLMFNGAQLSLCSLLSSHGRFCGCMSQKKISHMSKYTVYHIGVPQKDSYISKVSTVCLACVEAA